MNKNREIATLLLILVLQVVPWTLIVWDGFAQQEAVTFFLSDISLWLGKWWFFLGIVLSFFGLILAIVHACAQSQLPVIARVLLIIAFVLVTPVAVSIYCIVMIIRASRANK